jgi:hypothetical protein
MLLVHVRESDPNLVLSIIQGGASDLKERVKRVSRSGRKPTKDDKITRQ